MGTLFKHHGTSGGYLMEPLMSTKVLLVDDDNASPDL